MPNKNKMIMIGASQNRLLVLRKSQSSLISESFDMNTPLLKLRLFYTNYFLGAILNTEKERSFPLTEKTFVLE